MSKIWLSSPQISKTERQEISRALDDNELSLGLGQSQFNSSLEEYFKSKKVALVSSGTAALHLALIVLGIESGDEVFCSSLTFAATANPIKYCGATPVFIDSEASSWNICPELLEQAILDRRNKGGKLRAVIVVDLYGMPCDYSAISKICKEHDLLLIEDAAEGLGSSLNGKPLGSYGDIAVLSFNANKIITTGGGGALLSANSALIEAAAHLAAQARDPAEWYQHSKVGYNYRMNNIAAIMGNEQFKTLAERVEGRRKVFENYREKLADFSVTYQTEGIGSRSNRWLSAFVFPGTSNNWQQIQKALRAQDIESRPLWKPLHTQPIFKDCACYLNGVSEKLFSNGLCLPSNPTLTEEQQELICSIISQTLR